MTRFQARNEIVCLCSLGRGEGHYNLTKANMKNLLGGKPNAMPFCEIIFTALQEYFSQSVEFDVWGGRLQAFPDLLPTDQVLVNAPA